MACPDPKSSVKFAEIIHECSGQTSHNRESPWETPLRDGHHFTTKGAHMASHRNKRASKRMVKRGEIPQKAYKAIVPKLHRKAMLRGM